MLEKEEAEGGEEKEVRKEKGRKSRKRRGKKRMGNMDREKHKEGMRQNQRRKYTQQLIPVRDPWPQRKRIKF